MKRFLGVMLCSLFFYVCTLAQVKLNDVFSLSSYGRLGLSTSIYDVKFGTRLNLKGQGSIGGRHEESDYIELAPTVNFNSLLKLAPQTPQVKLVLRWAFFSGNSSFIASKTGTTMAEAYIEVDSLFKGKGRNVSLWLGQRFYRHFAVHIADYFFFNNYTSQGAGLIYHKTKIAVLTDVPFSSQGNPYGTSLEPFYQRIMLNFQQQIRFNESHSLHILGEAQFHALSSNDTLLAKIDTGDYGLVAGVLHEYTGAGGDKNYLSVRYGLGIANGPGDDNWSSRTFVTYGNPNVNGRFKGAYGLNIVESYLFNRSNKWNLEGYIIYRYAQGADNPILIPGYPRSNKKQDLTVGVRQTTFITNRFHLLSEAHYQIRDYYSNVGEIGNCDFLGQASMTKFSIIPTIVLTGQRNQFARPHLRLVYSIALYNDVAKEYRLSDFLTDNKSQDIGQYLGLKTEWWF